MLYLSIRLHGIWFRSAQDPLHGVKPLPFLPHSSCRFGDDRLRMILVKKLDQNGQKSRPKNHPELGWNGNPMHFFATVNFQRCNNKHHGVGATWIYRKMHAGSSCASTNRRTGIQKPRCLFLDTLYTHLWDSSTRPPYAVVPPEPPRRRSLDDGHFTSIWDLSANHLIGPYRWALSLRLPRHAS